MRADRLVSIVLLLQARGGMSAPDLARELEVSVRTVYRDAEALSSAGIPVWVERGPRGGIRLLDGYRTDLTGLSAGEAEALFLLGLPGPLAELGLRPAVDGARRKLLAALPAGRRQGAERIRGKIHVDPAGWGEAAGNGPHLVTMARALFADRRLRIDYVRADNRRAVRVVDPLGMVLKSGIWYLVASTGHWDVTFRVSRVRDAEVLDEPAPVRPDFDLVGHWETWVEELAGDDTGEGVRARILADAAAGAELPRVLGEHVRHQVVDASAGGAERIEIEVSYPSLSVACANVLGLGAAVEVLEPPELAAAVVAAAGAIVDRYRDRVLDAGPRPQSPG